MKISIEDNLTLLKSLKEKAFVKGSIDTSITESISYQLRMIPNEERSKYYDFVKDYLEEGFKYGLSQDDILLESFKGDASVYHDLVVTQEAISEKIEVVASLTSANDLFSKLKTELKDYFNNYKGYFITELINGREFGYKLIFFYEHNYHINPLKGWVKDKLGKYDCEFMPYSISSTPKLSSDHNYFCIFLLMSKMNDKEGLKSLTGHISSFISDFQEFYYHCVTQQGDQMIYENINRKDEFLSDVNIVLSTYLSNSKINFEEEKIIKKLCADFKSPLIFYKILSGGFSGSKVLEIRPKKTNNFDNDKLYIIKYGYKSEGKIKQEKDNFGEFIKGIKGFLDYTDADYKYTLHYEGILYNYAISENSKISYSFTEVVQNQSILFSDLKTKKEILSNLFTKNDAFKKWREDYNEIKEDSVGNLYCDYVSVDKIEKSLMSILNDISKVDYMVELYQKIANHIVKYKETVCHGDLHTDNFFIDEEKNIYLIDFGFTNKRHSVLDYSSLECSLKFRHFPFYIESEELIRIENELLNNKTFDFSFLFESTNRNEILDLLSMINTIRFHSRQDIIADNTLDYYISLFIITIRQIRYPNMNQLYAYHSSKILGEYIVEKLNTPHSSITSMNIQ